MFRWVTSTLSWQEIIQCKGENKSQVSQACNHALEELIIINNKMVRGMSDTVYLNLYLYSRMKDGVGYSLR